MRFASAFVALTLALAACSGSTSDDDAASGDGSTTVSENPAGTLTVGLDGLDELPLGEALELTMTLTNLCTSAPLPHY